MRLHLPLAGGVIAALALASTDPVAATPSPAMGPSAGGFVAQSEPDGIHVGFDVHDRAHIKNELRRLHEDAVAMQAGDGGRLSEAHRAEIEDRLALLRKEACETRQSGC